jgi:hypothetical protein
VLKGHPGNFYNYQEANKVLQEIKHQISSGRRVIDDRNKSQQNLKAEEVFLYSQYKVTEISTGTDITGGTRVDTIPLAQFDDYYYFGMVPSFSLPDELKSDLTKCASTLIRVSPGTFSSQCKAQTQYNNGRTFSVSIDTRFEISGENLTGTRIWRTELSPDSGNCPFFRKPTIDEQKRTYSSGQWFQGSIAHTQIRICIYGKEMRVDKM